MVPVISWSEASTFECAFRNFESEDAIGWMPKPNDSSIRVFALQISGESMEPRYQHNDIIFVLASHPNWMQQRLSLSVDTQIVPVLGTPSTKATRGAFPHLQNVALWSLNDFRTWAYNATPVIRDIRKPFTEPGDMVWRAEAAAAIEANGMDAPSMRTQIAATRLATDERSNE